MSDRPPTPDPFEERGEPSDLGAASPIAPGRKPAKAGSTDRPKRRVPAGALLVLALVAVVLLALVPGASSVLAKTPRDRVGISYGGGWFEGAHFQKIVQPGSGLFVNGLMDDLYLYPADQQNYIVSKIKGQGSTSGSDSIVAPTEEGVQVEYQVAAFFKLNIDRLRSFHEQLGLRYSAYTRNGWAGLITDTFRQQIENALQAETRRYSVDELVGSASVLTSLQSSVQSKVTQQLILTLGQQYFCGPTYTPGAKCGPITFVIKKIDIPPNVQASFDAVKARQKEADSIKILNTELSKAGKNYVLLKAIENGAIKFWVVPEGTDLALPANADGTPLPQGGTGTAGTDGTTTTSQPGG